jgi:hypothetical protein
MQRNISKPPTATTPSQVGVTFALDDDHAAAETSTPQAIASPSRSEPHALLLPSNPSPPAPVLSIWHHLLLLMGLATCAWVVSLVVGYVHVSWQHFSRKHWSRSIDPASHTMAHPRGFLRGNATPTPRSPPPKRFADLTFRGHVAAAALIVQGGSREEIQSVLDLASDSASKPQLLPPRSCAKDGGAGIPMDSSSEGVDTDVNDAAARGSSPAAVTQTARASTAAQMTQLFGGDGPPSTAPRARVRNSVTSMVPMPAASSKRTNLTTWESPQEGSCFEYLSSSTKSSLELDA